MTQTEFGQDVSVPTMEDIEDAARVLRGQATRTPLLENADVNARLGGRLLLKFCGAFARISRVTVAQKTRGVVTYLVNRRLLSGVVTASDGGVCDAMRFAYQHFKIVTEPGAAVGLAAVLSGQMAIKGKTVVAVITGGSVGPDCFSKAILTAESGR